MNSSQSQVNSKELSRQLEFVKQQEQLRAFKNATGSKTLSADSMIEELLSKKETFQSNKSETHQKQEPAAGVGAVPAWLTTPHPLYERVWAGVAGQNGLADTNLLSSLLMSSGLPTDTLGYIWSVVNRTVLGALTQQEVFLALALVGLAQAGYGVHNAAAVYQLPQAPVPTLNLSLLPTHNTVTANIYPNPLSVTTLPEPTHFTWVTPEPVPAHPADKIDISYVSSAPMVSPKLLLDQTKLSLTAAETVALQKNIVGKKSHSHSKHSGNNFTFSFPSLNESPSHTATSTEKPLDTDPCDDEFTDFQSADFTSANLTSATIEISKPSIDDDEFSNFQKASPKPVEKDLSVLVVGGKNLPSQKLWVAESPAVAVKMDKTTVRNTSALNVLDLFGDEVVSKTEKEGSLHKYDVFQEVEEDRFSVFHNPLADEDEKEIEYAAENVPPQSVFSHSLFHETTKPADNSDDEFSNFQTFPVSEATKSADKYDVFRTILFNDSEETKAADVIPPVTNLPSTDFGAFLSTSSSNKVEVDLFANVTKEEEDDDANFGDFQESLPAAPTNNSLPVLDMFSSLAISADTTVEPTPRPQLQTSDDKYKALRLLEPITDQTNSSDDFGEFLGADFPNSGPPIHQHAEKSSIQVRCLEACLNLLKAGLDTLSDISDPELTAEILADSRAKTYLDCLLEVHRVSERILDNVESENCVAVKSDIQQVWQSLAAFYTQTEHSPLVESAGAECGVCRSSTGPCPVVFGGLSFHSPCANLYLHCVDPVLPNIATVQSH